MLETVNDEGLKRCARLRIIIMTVLLIAVSLSPMLVTILLYSKPVAFQCKRKKIGWTSARNAPGSIDWGEKRIILKTGLSSSLDFSTEPASTGVRQYRRSG